MDKTVRIRHQHMRVAPAPLPPDHPDLFTHHDTVDSDGRDWDATSWGLDGAKYEEIVPPAQRIDTSLSAAACIQPHGARLREAVFQWIRVQGTYGATAGELCEALGLSGSCVRPRIRELEGDAPWAKGKLPRRITRTAAVRKRMHVYEAVALRDSGNP